jgi:hypothetical protein
VVVGPKSLRRYRSDLAMLNGNPAEHERVRGYAGGRSGARIPAFEASAAVERFMDAAEGGGEADQGRVLLSYRLTPLRQHCVPHGAAVAAASLDPVRTPGQLWVSGHTGLLGSLRGCCGSRCRGHRLQ